MTNREVRQGAAIQRDAQTNGGEMRLGNGVHDDGWTDTEIDTQTLRQSNTPERAESSSSSMNHACVLYACSPYSSYRGQHMVHSSLAVPLVIDRTRPRYLSPCTMSENGLLHRPAIPRLCQLHHPCKASAVSRCLHFTLLGATYRLPTWPCVCVPLRVA